MLEPAAMDPVNVRNLDQIQEEDPPRGPRLGTLLLAGLSGALIVAGWVFATQKKAPPARSVVDPLAALVQSARANGPVSPEQLEGREVTFPQVLSDSKRPTTALAAVRDERGRLVTRPDEDSTAAASAAPPPPTDRLPVVPLPVGALLSRTAVTRDPKDSLTQLAKTVSSGSDKAEQAEAGSDSGFQLQVASFKDPAEAEQLVEELRKRGHRAFRIAAQVPERGVWHRVRIGPFKNKFEATRYKEKFEKSERFSPFMVDPEKVKQAAERRAQQVEALQKKTKKKPPIVIKRVSDGDAEQVVEPTETP